MNHLQTSLIKNAYGNPVLVCLFILAILNKRNLYR